MNRRFYAGSALATLLVLPAAAYLTFELGTTAPPVGRTELAQGVTDDRRAEPVAAEKALPDAHTAALDTTPAETAHTEDAVAGRPDPKTEVETRQIARLIDKPAGSATIGRLRTTTTRPQSLQSLAAPAIADTPLLSLPESRERYANGADNPLKRVEAEPVSTFSADVDTASYSFVRKALMAGERPDPDSVRVEEMINYFPYDWPRPENAAQPFKATVTLLPTPWNLQTRLMHVAIKGYEPARLHTPRANLVFLIDISGSMNAPDKLPLLKSAFRLLVGTLKPDDTVSIVTYAGNAGIVLEPTAASERGKILAAIDTLEPGGSTAGAEGIESAYALAARAFVKDGINRVMLATDGDFNVGPSSDEALKRLIEDRRTSGIYLSVLGFGRGNLNDSLMQTLAQNGNGVAAYIDTLAEARKTLVEEAGAALLPIATDVKFQVEFNPAAIAEYRLIGYETRALQREDFNNDRVDAGDIGAGHSVTAIYEVTPKGSPAVMTDPLRYGPVEEPQPGTAQAGTAARRELAFVKIRYKATGRDESTLITTTVTEADAVASLDKASDDVRFSVAVAAFGQKLRATAATAAFGYAAIADLAGGARGPDRFGYRSEFVTLVRLAEGLTRP